MDEYDDDSGDGTASLISSLASNATQAYDTTQALNANPLNTAILYGGTASTTQGYSSAGSTASATLGASSGTILFLVAAGVLLFVLAKR
jgi:hypothetical protein